MDNLVFAEDALSTSRTIVWWPSFAQGTLPGQTLDAEALANKQFESEQWNALSWLYDESESHFPLGRPANLMKWSSRAPAIWLARKLGIGIPRYCLALNGVDASEFISRIHSSGSKVMMKRLSDNRFFIDGRVSIPVIVETEDFANSGPLDAPIWLEEIVEPSNEARVFVVGDNVRVFDIQDVGGNALDARLQGDRKFVRGQISSENSKNLEELTRAMKLRYCCFDILLKQNEMIVIDVNPLGTTDGFPVKFTKEVQSLIANEVLSWVSMPLDEKRAL
ncbi:ATP-grasp domain-containing protein [Sulfitobacter sp. M39]|uniref:ATP-grasp domain-containing protein n=1 Tax=Sulfitobacter sp. M39 TaxID=2675334 RepID=UPI001F2228FD|nr:ATP-grasp domain-containing protein [Sulfitobacter sp. M39]